MVVSVVSVVVWSRCCDGRSRRDGILARGCGDVCGLVMRGGDEVVSQGKVRMVEYLCEKALNKVESEKICGFGYISMAYMSDQCGKSHK